LDNTVTIAHIGGMLMNTTSADNRRSSIVLIISFCVFVLLLFLMEWDALTEAFYNVHEMIGALFALSLFVLPIIGIVWFVFWRRYIKSKVQSTITIMILNIVSLLLAVFCIVLPVIGLTTGRTSGSTFEIEKYSYENEYYVNLDDRSIRVSKDKYDEIEDGVVQGYAYSYEYIYNNLLLDRNDVFFVEIDKVKY